MSDAAPHFLSQLVRFERRLVLVAFVRYSPATVAIPALGVVGAVRLGRLSFVAATAVLLAGIAVASCVAAFVARWRVGSLARTAAALDARFGLSNRLATALQFSGAHDAVSALIVADASAALGHRQPQDLSFEAPRHLGWVAAGTVAVALGLALIGRPSNGSGEPVASEAVLNSGAGASASPDSRPTAAASANRVAVSGGDVARSMAAGGDRQPSASQSSSSVRQSDTMPQRDAAGRTGSSTEGEQRRAATTRPESNSALGSSGLAGNNAAGPAGVQATTAGGIGVQASSAKPTLGGGISSADPRGTTTRAGGVRGALPVDSGSIEKQHELNGPANVTPAVAWDRAETALAREHLPIEWRSYVRDYLIAIRPGRQP
jgi:hypothetical protein